MSAFMDLEPPSSRIALATNVAFERLLASMNQLVGLQMPFSDELLATALECARKWSFSRLHEGEKILKSRFY